MNHRFTWQALDEITRLDLRLDRSLREALIIVAYRVDGGVT